MNIHFDQPLALLFALLLVPLLALGWRATRGIDLFRRMTVLAARALLLIALVGALSGPQLEREHNQLTVIGLLDVSGSVRRFAEIPRGPEAEQQTYLQHVRAWFREATDIREPDDRFGLVVFDGDAIAIAAPTTTDYSDDAIDMRIMPGTNIADAIRLGLALFPPDSARRLILVSDGNETMGDALDTARVAISDRTGSAVPIDVLPIAYEITGDVQIVGIEAPASARQGQTVTVRIILDATRSIAGRLTLRREGDAVDLNGAEPGTSRAIEVPAGRSVQLATVTLGDENVNRFEAFFDPINAADDELADNNRAEAFTATPGKGDVLIIAQGASAHDHAMRAMLETADIPVKVALPGALAADTRNLLLDLQNHDLIVLDNVPASALSDLQQRMIARYVNDLGGGLIMIGGEYSFGAGGWNGTPIEEILPLELDPPKELRLPQAALVLVLDNSGSMSFPVAGARASQQEVANEAAAIALKSLRADTLIGVVTFNSFASEYVPLQRNDEPEAIAQRVRSITPGGGTNIAAGLAAAQRMLKDIHVDRKRVVLLTDGRSPDQDLGSLVSAMKAEGIGLSTIGVGNDADENVLRRLADLGGGEFYPVYNPNALPRVLVDSVQIINKPLIKEGPFTPIVQTTGSTLTAGLSAAPSLAGLVVTAPRPEPTAVVEMTHPDGEPLLARWQAGLGRAAAFTSDLGGEWSQRWTDWPTAQTFWVQLVRSTARPSRNHDAELISTITGDTLELTLEAARDGAYLDYLEVPGTVFTPSGEALPVRLHQTAPGRYEASLPAREPGNYIAALNPRRGEERFAPVIGGASQSASPEFRAYQSNLALLEEIVELSGGRRLDLAQPKAVNLFDRAGMPPSVSLLPVWRAALLIAIALLLMDIATRRIAWSAAAVRALLARAWARVTPAHVRGGEAAATLATLRMSSEQREAQQQSQIARSSAPTLRAPRASPSSGKPAAHEPSRVAAALNTLLGRTKSRERRAIEHTEQERKLREEIEMNRGSTETTSELLAAKRRTREKLRGDE